MKLITSIRKQTLIFLVILILPGIGYAQIQGSVHNLDNTPLSFANVMLLDQKDSSVVTGMMATDEGIYSITNFKPGMYIIGVSMIGYKPTYSAPFVIKTTKDHHHNDPIFVEEDSHQIQDVNVVAKKPLYEMKIDRMVVNVENSITSSGNTALEVLEKSPGVVVDRQNNGISLAGKGGVSVMINGKQTRMPLEAAVQMLDGMSADNVKRIELITTPPAKYDAEGDAGIINIVLKKNEDFGTNGSFTLGAGVSTREKMNGSLNLNHHVEKVNYYGTYSANFNNMRQNIQSFRRYSQTGSVLESDANSAREALILFQNIRMGLDYTVTSKTVLSILGAGYVRDWEANALNTIAYSKDMLPDGRSNLEMDELSKWIHGMGNVNLQHHFKEEEVLDINLDYLNYYNDNPSDYTVEKLDNSGQLQTGEDIEVSKITPINIAVGMVDYTNQINSKLKVEAGAKGTFTFFKNNVGVSYFTSGRWTPDPELTNNYSLNENISALYSSVSYSFSDNTSVVAGLRYEYMNSVLDSETEKGIVDLHYGEFFPSIYFSQKLNKNNTWQFSYSRRIDRPTFNELAPFIVFMTPETFVSGNENLLPAFSNILKTDYQYKMFMLSFSYTDTKNSIARFQPKFSEDQTKQYFISRNFDNSKTLNVMFAFPVTVTDWWKMQNNFNWIKNITKTSYDGVDLELSRSNYRANSIQSFRFSKRISVEVSGNYQSKSIWGIYEQKARGRVDLGIQMKLKNENSRFDLNLTDAFKTNIGRSVANVPELNIYTQWRLDFEPRVLRLSFTHNFGNSTVKTRKRNTASDEEQRRISN